MPACESWNKYIHYLEKYNMHRFIPMIHSQKTSPFYHFLSSFAGSISKYIVPCDIGLMLLSPLLLCFASSPTIEIFKLLLHFAVCMQLDGSARQYLS